MKNTLVNKICKKTDAEIQPKNPNPQKDKKLTANPSSGGHVKLEPLADSACEDNVPLPVLDMLLANKDTLSIKNLANAKTSLLEKQHSNSEQPVITSTSLAPSLSSNVTNLADKMVISSKTIPSSNDKVIFSPSLNTNRNVPIMLSSNNSVLKPTNCLTAPGQPTNWVTAPSQSTNWVTASGQSTNWVTAPSKPTNWVTAPSQPTNWVATPGQPTNWVTALGQPTNWVTGPGQSTNWLTAPGQSTLPANTVTYVLMSAGQAPVYLGNSANALTRILPKNTTVPARTNTSSATTTTATTTATAIMPVPIRPAERSTVPNISGQLSSLKDIKAKSTFVQIPIQVSTLANNKINISDPNQNIAQLTVPQKILKQTNLENKEKLSQIPVSMNVGILKSVILPNNLKPETNNHRSPVVQSSDINSVTTVQKPGNESSSSPCEILNNEVTIELSKTGRNETKDGSNLTAGSCEKTKSTTSEDNKALSSKENNVLDPSSILEKIKVFLAKPTTNKLLKNRPRKFLVPSKFKGNKQIPVFSATENTGIGVTSKLSGFNLPSGNYVIHSEELKADLSQSETEKLLTCEEKDNESDHGSIKRRPSLEGKTIKNGEKITIKTEPLDDDSEGSQGYSLSVPCTSSRTSFPANTGIKRKSTNEGEIIIKTEPLDYESRGSQDHNLSDQCVSSTASFPADIEMKTTYDSEIESTPAIKEKNEDNDLVISSCFSLSINSEDERKLPFDATNSNLHNLFFLPQQANFEDANDIPNENSTNGAKRPKFSEFPVELESSALSSDSPVLSTAEETQIPCSKKLRTTSPYKSTIDPEYSKKLKENDLSDDKTKNSSSSPLQSNKASLNSKLIGSPEENQIPSTKKWYEVSPYKSIIDPEYVKKLKENNLSDDKTKNSARLFELNKEPLESKLIGSPEEKQIPCSKKWYEVSLYKSIIDQDYVKKLKEKDLSDDQTKISTDPFEVNKASLSPEEKQIPCAKKWYEVSPYKSIIDQDYVNKLKEKDLSDDKTKISVDTSELNKVPVKTKLITISDDILTTPSCVDKALTSDKNLAPRLPSADDFVLDDLTKDKEADSFLEGRIAFHQQQLHLLQLQVDQHKTTLEKLKKAQNYLRELT